MFASVKKSMMEASQQQQQQQSPVVNPNDGSNNNDEQQEWSNSSQSSPPSVTTHQPQHHNSSLSIASCLSGNSTSSSQLSQPNNPSPPAEHLILPMPKRKASESGDLLRDNNEPEKLVAESAEFFGWPKEYEDLLFKRLKITSESENADGNQGTRQQTTNKAIVMESQVKDVHITQPYSLPTSPIASPRPSSATFNTLNVSPPPSPTPNFVSQNLAVVQSKPSSRIASVDKSTHEQDWQASKTGVRERNAAMCNNDLMADVYFAVSNNGGPCQKFPAHKYVLATGSSVFFAMFYGSLAETSEEIKVPDVEPDAFFKMLMYLYADEIDLDEESVLPTLHVAKKYIIPYLAKACVQYMEASLTARNACILLCQSRIFDEPELMQRCWEVIDAQAEIALNSEGFIDIDHSTLQSILSRETLNCKELHVFNAAMAWAAAECERREIDPLPENLRAVLGDALQLIRVPTMELKEFADGPAQVGIFSLQECHAMFLNFTATNKPKLAYPVIPRMGLKPQVCHRFQSSAYRSNQWRYRGRCDSIQFCVDRRIFIVGFGLYGSSTGATTYGVHIELKRQGRILAENNTEFFSDGSSNTFHVYFRQPVQIDPDVYYTASAILDGMELSYFGQEGLTDVMVGNVTFQFQCSTESTNGTGVQGGQIPELIFYGPNSTETKSVGTVVHTD